MADAGYYTKSIGKDHFGWEREQNEGIPHGYMVQCSGLMVDSFDTTGFRRHSYMMAFLWSLTTMISGSTKRIQELIPWYAWFADCCYVDMSCTVWSGYWSDME